MHLSSLVRAKLSEAERARKGEEISDIILLSYKKREPQIELFYAIPTIALEVKPDTDS